MIRAVALAFLSLVPTAAASAPPRLVLPYDLEARRGALYVADGLRHQILRYDLATGRLTVFAGTGAEGATGDGGPAVRARLTEPTELVFDRAGNLYFSDVHEGRVRRIDRSGTITTVTKIPAAAGLSVDPTGRYLAIASIEGSVFRMRLPAGRLERLVANLDGPHDVTYDRKGNLLIAGGGDVRRLDAVTGRIETAFTHPGFKIVSGERGTYYLLDGDPDGGTVTQLDEAGNVLKVIGTHKLAKQQDQAGIAQVGFLPSDVEPIPGGILITQTKPMPAIRKLDEGSQTLTTLVR